LVEVTEGGKLVVDPFEEFEHPVRVPIATDNPKNRMEVKFLRLFLPARKCPGMFGLPRISEYVSPGSIDS
jgi:hypothetical protein